MTHTQRGPYQMRLFVDPEEHMKELAGAGDLVVYPSAERMWDTKVEESKHTWEGPSLYDKIEKSGVHTPITTVLNTKNELIQWDGHHRLAAAAHIQRTKGKAQHVPIEYLPYDYNPSPDELMGKPYDPNTLRS